MTRLALNQDKAVNYHISYPSDPKGTGTLTETVTVIGITDDDITTAFIGEMGVLVGKVGEETYVISNGGIAEATLPICSPQTPDLYVVETRNTTQNPPTTTLRKIYDRDLIFDLARSLDEAKSSERSF